MSATSLSLTEPRLQAAMQAALAHVRQTVVVVADRIVDSLGTAALGAGSGKQRDALLAAQFDLRRKLAAFHTAFVETLTQKVQKELAPRGAERSNAPTDWQSLSLVDDKHVEELVGADRLGQAIAQDCEWELRELDGYFGALLRTGRAEKERNPLRPEVLGKALFRAIEAVTDAEDPRKLLATEIGRALGQAMRVCYAEIAADLRARGVQPVGLTVKTVEGPGHDTVRSSAGSLHSSVAGPYEETLGLPTDSAQAPFSPSGSGGLSSTRGGGPTTGGGPNSGPGRLSGAAGTPIGTVDAQMMALLRRLAFLGNVAPDTVPAAMTGGDAVSGLMAANLIHAHRDELRSASTGTLDHMVIDVVGSLFDQILSDPKVPPQMARLIARLQLPVLRVALGDVTFFSSRRHPVRRLVNRIASLACAFDDFAEPPGSTFLKRVGELVQEIVGGDFDQMEVYEGKLADLEAFIAEQTHAEVERAAGEGAPAMFDSKEDELRLQQRYMQQLQVALAPVAMPDFLRAFLTQVWSQAIVHAVRHEPDPAVGVRMRRAATQLVMSVQPKGAPAQRKAFLLGLPTLMRDLNDGLSAVGWADGAKKEFFGQLMPAHAESLKGGIMRELDHNLLVKQLEGIFNAALPRPEDLRRGDAVPVLNDVVAERQFSAAEKQQIGLVEESAVDWDGTVDIEVGADEPELTAADVDINIDGLPPADEPPDPARGPQLMDVIQIGFAYQMHLNDSWQKVRLSYVSPGRAFFVFTRGRKHQQTISMTSRMVARMCDTGRLRAFENAYLIERATARARQQLAALGAKPAAAPARLH